MGFDTLRSSDESATRPLDASAAGARPMEVPNPRSIDDPFQSVSLHTGQATNPAFDEPIVHAAQASTTTAASQPVAESYRRELAPRSRMDVATRLRAFADNCPVSSASDALRQEATRSLVTGVVGDGLLDAGVAISNASTLATRNAQEMEGVLLAFCSTFTDILPDPARAFTMAQGMRARGVVPPPHLQAQVPAPMPKVPGRTSIEGVG